MSTEMLSALLLGTLVTPPRLFWSGWSGWSGLAWLLVTFFSLSRDGIRRGLGLEGLCYSCTGGQEDWPVSVFPLLLSLACLVD